MALAETQPASKEAHKVSHPVRVVHAKVQHPVAHQVSHPATRVASHHVVTHARVQRVAYRSNWISCVPYARTASGISVAGNAWQWWGNASGQYERGSVPEPGSVLAFRANGRMRLGHVAVVSRVINNREIEVDHSNWAGHGIMRDVAVVDVSENNDWTAVRVSLGRGDSFGSVYPTYGFIYDRPDDGRMLTAITTPAPTPDLNPAPRDLRPLPDRTVVARAVARHYDEVAEAPEHPRPTHRVALTGDHH